MAPLLEIRDLTVEYRSAAGIFPAVIDFSLAIAAGESFGLVGESGCGKSTLAMAIMGYLGRNGRVAEGEIRFEGTDLVRASEASLEALRGARLSMVYQEPSAALNPTMPIGHQLMEVPIRHQGASASAAREQAMRMLADVEMPDPATVMRRYPHQLSGGQKQRVVIAMALLANPALLIMDEPTTGLDVTVEASVLDLVNALRRKYGTTVIYISHNLGVIAQVCERVGVMYAGELVELATVRELFAEPRHPYTQGLLTCIPRFGSDKRGAALVPIPGQIAAAGARPPGCAFGPRCGKFRPGLCDAAAVPLDEAETGHAARCLLWREPGGTAPPPLPAMPEDTDGVALEVMHLSKVYELGTGLLPSSRGTLRLVANDDLSFVAERGRILAIVGESGSGKSTFARVLTGLQTATRGEIRFAGANLATTPVRRRSRAQARAIQMVFQNPDATLNPAHSIGWGIARAVKKLGVASGRRGVAERVGALLEMVRLAPSLRHRKPRQLSGGQKQRVAIARAFAGDPSLVLADEPVSALDVSVQAAIVNLLLRIQAERRTTIVWISHDLVLVRHLADAVVVMYLGKVMEMGPVGAIFAPPYHPYTEALLSAVPFPDPSVERKRIRLKGETPSPLDLPPGCRFASRCPRKLGAICDREAPPLCEAGPGHVIACHIPIEELRRVDPVFEAPRPTMSGAKNGAP
jgi:peptide/nickel transport system ATP-binding protein